MLDSARIEQQCADRADVRRHPAQHLGEPSVVARLDVIVLQAQDSLSALAAATLLSFAKLNGPSTAITLATAPSTPERYASVSGSVELLSTMRISAPALRTAGATDSMHFFSSGSRFLVGTTVLRPAGDPHGGSTTPDPAASSAPTPRARKCASDASCKAAAKPAMSSGGRTPSVPGR
jgi:hypothetical protein